MGTGALVTWGPSPMARIFPVWFELRDAPEETRREVLREAAMRFCGTAGIVKPVARAADRLRALRGAR